MIDKSIKKDTSVIMKIVFYKSDSGGEPVREWLQSLNKPDRKSVGEDLKTVQYGWPLGMPIVKKLDADLWQIRSHIKNGIARVIFTIREDTIILLHGFIKKSDRIPQDELNTAKQRNKSFQ